ncbi:MAG: hypothetical protein IPK60_01950 [Sandaracinaceae bacterium]|nr:hypothetical protein [Sandaracinaceae bacterium]
MRVLSFGLCAAWMLSGCSGHADETTSPPTAAPVEQAPAPAAAPVVAAPAGPVVTDTGFELRATPEAGYRAGQAGTFAIALTPSGNYHVNQEYPIRVTLRAPSGVTLQKAELVRADAAEFGERLARFSVPFTATAAGTPRVEAEVDFAVCTPENCMPDRRTVAVTLAVQ